MKWWAIRAGWPVQAIAVTEHTDGADEREGSGHRQNALVDPLHQNVRRLTGRGDHPPRCFAQPRVQRAREGATQMAARVAPAGAFIPRTPP